MIVNVFFFVFVFFFVDEIFIILRKSRRPRASRTFADQGLQTVLVLMNETTILGQRVAPGVSSLQIPLESCTSEL